MNFEFPPKPGDIIDLSKFEKKKTQPKRSQEEIENQIDSSMGESAQIINNQLSKIEGAPKKFLDQKGQIRLDSYYDLYKEELIADKERTKDQKNAFLGANKNTTDSGIKDLEKKNRMRDGNVTEEVIFLMLNKVLRDKFVVARSSDYDDYENGTDLLLIDKNTGKTVCAFDETVESTVNGNVKSRMKKKMERAVSRLTSGRGMNVKYGVTFEDNRMVLGKIDKIPPLFLALDKSDLKILLQEMDFSINSPVSKNEKNVLYSLLNKLKTQLPELKESAHSSISLDAVSDFIDSLERILENFEV